MIHMSERVQNSEHATFRVDRGMQSDINRAVAVDQSRWTDPYTFVRAQERELGVSFSPEPAQTKQETFEPSMYATTSWGYRGELKSFSRNRSGGK